MTLNFRKKKQDTDASANVVDGKLVLSLPDAISPIVWQMDLTTVKASALEIKHDEEKGTHALILKTIKGENAEVAVFKTRSHALEGLMAASNAMEAAHGQIRNEESEGAAPTARSNKTSGGAGRIILKILLGLLVLWIAFTIWSFTIPITQTSGGISSTSMSGANPQSSSGVPVSADDFLRGQ